MLDKTVPVDIALLPVDKSCDAFNFEHEWKVYDGATINEVPPLNSQRGK